MGLTTMIKHDMFIGHEAVVENDGQLLSVML